jgi:hypothetical protein
VSVQYRVYSYNATAQHITLASGAAAAAAGPLVPAGVNSGMSMKGAMALMTLSGMFSLSKVNRELMNTCGWVREREGERGRERGREER